MTSNDIIKKTVQLPATRMLALALGAMACGALAVGALAVGKLAIGRLIVRRSKFAKVEIGDLIVRRLTVLEPGSDSMSPSCRLPFCQMTGSNYAN